jgi:hypothetical protein
MSRVENCRQEAQEGCPQIVPIAKQYAKFREKFEPRKIVKIFENFFLANNCLSFYKKFHKLTNITKNKFSLQDLFSLIFFSNLISRHFAKKTQKL